MIDPVLVAQGLRKGFHEGDDIDVSVLTFGPETCRKSSQPQQARCPFVLIPHVWR